MSSRIERKAAARGARLAAEARTRRAAAKRRALRQLAAVATLAGLAVFAAVLLGAGGDDRTAESTRLEAVPQDGIALGAPDAPATLVEFADLQCPFCADYARDVLPTIVDRYVRDGRLRLELHLRAFLGEDSVRGALVASAAARQDRLWSFVDGFYRHQGPENSGYATDAFLRERADAVEGLDTDRVMAERSEPAARRPLERAERLATRLRSDSTPAFYLRHGDGPLRPLPIAELTPQAFTTAIDDALAAR
jgi:protein-disulfide isomerase